ncbi:Permease of the drug/metabolite transporter (DMT) superfamily [hydrothermal vent metagenome]|uniref:Permease of the drug/metabolite transporter (DMT) superfamily n=1 Tax=hydrothermal vent metagenome TaxID=652676 RepID=A0A3B0TPJ2_9ZZZZ
MNLRDWLWIFLLGIIWGFSFPFNALLLRELGPLWVSAGRVGVGAIGSWVILLALKKTIPTDPGLLLRIVLLGIVTYAIPFALFPLAQQHLSAGVAAIINAMTPITTVIVSHLWVGGEKISWPKALGVGAGFAGVAILALPALQAGGVSELWAIGAGLLATLCYATSLNYTKSMQKIDPTVLATLALSGAAIFASIIALLFDGTPTITKSETWISLLGIGLISTMFAFQIMYRMLPRVGPTNFTVTTFIAPISAIILSVSLLGEQIQITQIFGMLAIFTGLLLIDGRIVRRWRRAKA